MIKPRTGAIIGGITGLALGFILLPDIAAGPVFGMLVFGFIGFEALWALNTIKLSNDLARDKNAGKQKKKGAKGAANKKEDGDSKKP